MIDVPVPTEPAPHDELYHCQVAPAVNIPETFNVVEVPEQIVPLVAEAPVGASGGVHTMYCAHI